MVEKRRIENVRCPICGAQAEYDSRKTSSGNYVYLHYFCHRCHIPIRIQPPPTHALDHYVELLEMQRDISTAWKERAIKYERGVDEANRLFSEIIENMKGLVGADMHDEMANYLFRSGKINSPNKFELLRYAMKLLRQETQKEIQKEIDQIRARQEGTE